MNDLIFGISGLPVFSNQRKLNYAAGIAYLKSIGLDAMELLFVRNVNVTDNNKDAIVQASQEHDIYLSAHGSHYTNLNADDKTKQDQSMARIIAAAEGLSKAGGRSLIFHPGYYLQDSADETYHTIRDNLLKLPAGSIDYRLETTGKGTQFGTLQELVALCREVDTCKLCIDFAHIHARENGSLRSYEDFAGILQYVLDHLGRAALDDLHIHMGGIRYNAKGEIAHLPVLDSDFNYKSCLQAIKDFQVKGCIIAEGPLVEQDALLLKNTYAKL